MYSRILLAAKASNSVQFVVLTHASGLRPDEDRSIAGDWALECEKAVIDSGINYAIVRHAALFSGISERYSKVVRNARALKMPFPDTLLVAWAHPHDVAKAITNAALQPQLSVTHKVHLGRDVCRRSRGS